MISFQKKHGRAPTKEETIKATQEYIENPEKPEDYQKRIFGKVKYPLSLEKIEV
jgi:hypothetical protein